MMFAVCSTAENRPAVDYATKARFLFNFAKFVEWPPGSFSQANDPIRLCLFGVDPFAGAVERAVQGKTVGGRILRVEHPRDANQARGCHLLFVGEQQKPNPARLHGYGLGVLTVGESSDFARVGGIVGFVQRQNRVAFEINLQAANRSRLKISSKLLRLARIVSDD